VLWIQSDSKAGAWVIQVHNGTRPEAKGGKEDMGSNTINPAPLLNRNSSDEEILGLLTHSPRRARREANSEGRDSSAQDSRTRTGEQLAMDFSDKEAPQETRQGSATDTVAAGANDTEQIEPEHLRAALDANPELRDAWQEARAYRETFATPEEAGAATASLGDLNRMDALFFSRRPEDHAELARAVSKLDPEAFASLARAMNALANDAARKPGDGARTSGTRELFADRANRTEQPAQAQAQNQIQSQETNQSRQREAGATLSAAQVEFFHSTNAAAVSSVMDAIESQVERLLPEGISKSARNRVVGEIYRELDTTLRGNRALGQQMRDAFRSGGLDEEHQRAIVSLVTGRARQALPGVAKRVLNEWTTTVVSANHERRARQRTAERRVDIAGSGGAGNDGRRAVTSRDVDYKWMSDADILNL
jgi:hypothetical protein